jgi:hypothetical protein
MRGTLRRAGRKVRAMRRRLFQDPETAAWRRAWHRAELTPQFTPGEIRMVDYDLRDSDLSSFCTQWQDIFVRRVLAFRSNNPASRIFDCGANVGLHRVAAIVMDPHEFDPRTRQAPRVLERLTRAGFSYAIDEFVPLTWRESLAGPQSPFPDRAMNWAMTVRAWR